MTETEIKANLDKLQYFARELNTDAVLDKYNLDFVVFPGFTMMNMFNALSGTCLIKRH